ncbi:MAG: hypothetical protein AB7F94_10645 [Nitrospira sp.]
MAVSPKRPQVRSGARGRPAKERADRTVLNFDEGDRPSPAEPWVYLKLHAQDKGQAAGRTNRSEYVKRAPHCVSNFSRNGLQIEISNAGMAASDLVVVEYELIYCSYEGHGPADGYSTIHAGEVQSTPLDRIMTAAYVPPGGSIAHYISFPEQPGLWLRNLYFRARVVTLWEQKLPKDQWDFATDPRVTEAYIAVSHAHELLSARTPQTRI